MAFLFVVVGTSQAGSIPLVFGRALAAAALFFGGCPSIVRMPSSCLSLKHVVFAFS